MLLNAVKKINLSDWKIVLVGPIESTECHFQNTIDEFFTLNPNFKNRVIFTGPIYDKEKLWKWYNRSKVFILTSQWEGFAVVLCEALRFRNYIISTNVGGAKEIIGEGYGEIVNNDDCLSLSESLRKIIEKEKNLEDLYEKVNWNPHKISWEYLLNNLNIQ
jgi:glycosyltransferase involved in cell wall biosynthesis